MTNASSLPRLAWVRHIMGMPVSVHVRGAGLARSCAEPAVAAMFLSLREADSLFSPYSRDSQLSRWGQGGLALADADPALAEVLGLCEAARIRTDGYFDARSLPDPLGEGMRFDPSGLVKGWAVERAAQSLAGLRDLGWCLNAGGDVLVHSPTGHPPWRIGVENPFDHTRIARVVRVRDGAVATSGTSHRGAHIINPHTGRAATAACSVTVTGASLMWADVYGTAAVARGEGAAAWLDGIDGYAATIIRATGEVELVPA